MSTRADARGNAAVDDDPVRTMLANLGDEFFDQFNDDHSDALLLIARHLAERQDTTAARLADLDPDGIDLDVDNGVASARVRVVFAEPITDPMKITRAMLELVTTARARSGLGGTTRFERAMAEAEGFRTRLAEVVAVRDIHPYLRSITFGRGGLDTLRVIAPDTFLYLLLPPAGRAELTIDEDFSFDDYSSMPADTRPVGAYYTVRRWDPQRHEVEMYFVLHDDDGGTATASGWARHATVGSPCALWGPRTAWEPPDDTDRYVLVADETGLPAVARILESLPPEVPATVVAEADHAGVRQDLGDRANTRIIWLDRNGAPPGSTTLLADTVRSLGPPEGRPYIWGGAESHAMTAIRKHLRHEVGLDRDAVSLTGYWRLPGVAGTQ